MQGKMIAKIRLPLGVLLPAAPWFSVVAAAVMAAGLGLVGRSDVILQVAVFFGLFIGALTVVCSPICALVCPVRISTEGVAAHNAWDARILNYLPWSSVTAVEECRFMGVRCLRIRGRDLTAVWIPRGLVGSDDFRAAIREAAPIGNPLRSYFDQQEISQAA